MVKYSQHAFSPFYIFIKHLPLANVGGRTVGARMSFGDPVQLFDMYVLSSYENHIYNVHIYFLLNLN